MSDDGRTTETPADGAAAASPGTRLAAAREALGLSSSDIARQLKLSVWQVEALEAGRYEQLPGSIFVRGFIRNYARLVKVDPEELLQAASGSLPRDATHPESPPSRDIPFPGAPKRTWPAFAFGAIGFVAVLVFYEFYWKGGEPPAVTVVAESPERQAVAGSAATSVASREATSPPASGMKASIPSGVAVAVVSSAARDVVPVEAAAKDATGAPRPGERMIRLVFEQESWVEIRDRSGAVLLSKLNQPGSTQKVSGVAPLAIVIGNAQGVKMTLDDQAFDLARHTKVDVARFTLE